MWRSMWLSPMGYKRVWGKPTVNKVALLGDNLITEGLVVSVTGYNHIFLLNLEISQQT